jgi:hypothetical protein
MTHARIASGITLIAGIWLMVSPRITGVSNQMMGINSSMFLGAVISLIGLYRLADPKHGVWLSWLNLLIGLWVLIMPFILNNYSLNEIVSNFVVGLIVAVTASVSAAETAKIKTSGMHGGMAK